MTILLSRDLSTSVLTGRIIFSLGIGKGFIKSLPIKRSSIVNSVLYFLNKSSKDKPSEVKQFSSRTIISCATSTKRLVKYPESAVRRAVSTRPFLAPYEEIIYSVTFNPSRKLLLIGRSIICPWGSAINPRIPTSCLTCEIFPRAPEKAIMYKGFKGSLSRK